jgi:hypothetical protein
LTIANVIVYCRSKDNLGYGGGEDRVRAFRFSMALHSMIDELDEKLSQHGYSLTEWEEVCASWLKWHTYGMFLIMQTYNKASVGLLYTKLVLMMPAADINYKQTLDRRPWVDQTLLEVLALLRLNMSLATRGCPAYVVVTGLSDDEADMLLQ